LKACGDTLESKRRPPTFFKTSCLDQQILAYTGGFCGVEKKWIDCAMSLKATVFLRISVSIESISITTPEDETAASSHKSKQRDTRF
jgi:hypothetical protein